MKGISFLFCFVLFWFQYPWMLKGPWIPTTSGCTYPGLDMDFGEYSQSSGLHPYTLSPYPISFLGYTRNYPVHNSVLSILFHIIQNFPYSLISVLCFFSWWRVQFSSELCWVKTWTSASLILCCGAATNSFQNRKVSKNMLWNSFCFSSYVYFHRNINPQGYLIFK